MSKQAGAHKGLPTKPGRHGFGAGLWLQVRDAKHRSWLLRYKLNGHAREMGLGSAETVTLGQARAELAKWADVLRSGRDPIEVRAGRGAGPPPEAPRVPTFEEEAESFMRRFGKSWRNPKHRRQWASTLKTYAYPVIGGMLVSDIGTDDVLRVLEPIWETKTVTATRVRQRMERVLGSAIARGFRTAANPARWRENLDNLLPDPKTLLKKEHYAAMPWKEVPLFMARLRATPGKAAKALEFQILNVARPGMALEVRWKDLDLDGALWLVPWDHMKSKKPFKVPLSEQAVALLRSLQPERCSPDAFVFPGEIPGKPLSDTSMTMLARRLCAEKRRPTGAIFRDLLSGEVPVPHGFRSSFADWRGDATFYPKEVAEAVLAHAAGDAVTVAYRRGDPFEFRAQLMQEWADYCDSHAPVAKDAAPVARPPEPKDFRIPRSAMFPTSGHLAREAARLTNMLVGVDDPAAVEAVRALQAFLRRPGPSGPRQA